MSGKKDYIKLDGYTGYQLAALVQLVDEARSSCFPNGTSPQCIDMDEVILNIKHLKVVYVDDPVSSISLEQINGKGNLIGIFRSNQEKGSAINNFLLAHMYGVYCGRSYLPQNIKTVNLKANKMLVKPDKTFKTQKAADTHVLKLRKNPNREYPFLLYNYFAAKFLIPRSAIVELDKELTNTELAKKFFVPEFVIKNIVRPWML